jgi:hypothetical protein
MTAAPATARSQRGGDPDSGFRAGIACSRLRLVVVTCVAVAVAAGVVRDAAAQSTSPASGRIEVSAGAAWIGPQTYGAADATERTASNGTSTLFTTSTELGSAPGFDLRAGVRVAGTLVVEADASYTRPELRIEIANDVENAAPVTAVEPIQQFTIGAGATWYVPSARRLAPFLTGGAGYVRQLHEHAVLVDTGRYYQVGGGVAYLLASRTRGWLKASGIRADARAIVFSDGVAVDGGRHAAPAVTGSFFVRF